MLDNYSDILTAREVMAILDIRKELFYKLLRTNQITGYKVGRKWRFNKETFVNDLHNMERRVHAD